MAPQDTSAHTDQGDYEKNSLSLTGAVSMGTGVMIGAGIFALTGQVAELAGEWFPLAFVAAALVAAFSAYSYIKMSNAFPSAGGIAMILQQFYGKSTVAGACALLMYFSMVINESLVARTFGTYTLQLFDVSETSWWVPALGLGLLALAFSVNILGNKVIQSVSFVTSLIKIGGLVLLAGGGLWATGVNFSTLLPSQAPDSGLVGFVGAVALALLGYKGFTTITNSGGEIKKPHQNVGRAIIISLIICAAVYLLVTFAVGSNLSIQEIIGARDYSLARAAQPAFGQTGEWLTIGLAIVATVSGVIASVFAVSRMLAMLTEMKLAPYRSFGLPGDVQAHTLAYTIVIAALLTVFFDLSRIASLGAIFYLIMDMAVHWGLIRRRPQEVQARTWVPVIALGLDAVVLGAFLVVKGQNDPLILGIAAAGLLLIFGGERWFLRAQADPDEQGDTQPGA